MEAISLSLLGLEVLTFCQGSDTTFGVGEVAMVDGIGLITGSVLRQ